MNVKNACLAYVVLLVAIGAFLNWIFSRESPMPHYLPSAIGSFLIVLGVLYLHGALNHLGELAMVRRSLTFQPFEDGERIAAVGPVSPLRAAIEAPFSRTPCVAYEYEIFRWDTRGDSTSKDKAFWGLALTPSAITTPRGRVNLLAWMNLDFKEGELGSDSHYENARRYVDETPFKTLAAGSVKEAWGELKDLLADDDGSIRKDLSMETREVDIRAYKLSEKVLEVDEEVCAFGRYSAARGGLVPDPKTFAHGITIVRGDAEAAVRKIRRRFLGNFIAGVVLSAVGVTGVVFYLRWLGSTI